MLEQEKLKQVIELGKSYRYKKLCELLQESRYESQNKKKEQQDDWSRYFDYDITPKFEYVIHKIYDQPSVGLENGFSYKTIIIPVKCSKKDYEYLEQCRHWAGECWNALVKADKEYYDSNGKYMTRGALQDYVKNITPLHANGNQHIYLEYFTSRDAMFRSIQAKHKNSDKVNLPYKEKNYFVVGWNLFSFTVDYTKKEIRLAKKAEEFGRVQTPVSCSFKSLPRYIVEIELIKRKGLCLAIKYKEPKVNANINGNNVAAIDLGEIHSITSIDNNGNAIIITGRKLRSIQRLRNKELGKLKSKRSKTVKNSNQYKKYSEAIRKLSLKTDNQISDCIHKISKMYLDYCIENEISKVYYGDLDSCTRGTHGKVSKMVNQKLNNWCYGMLTQQLENKLSRYGIEMIKVSEAYTSQTCPHCGSKYKPTNRNYKCECGYTQHRDLVGAMNILNFYEENIHIERYEKLEYLRID